MGQHHHLNEDHEYFRLLGQTYNIEKLSRVAISPAWNLFGYIEDTRDPISFLATEKFAREIAPRGVTFYPKGFSKYGTQAASVQYHFAVAAPTVQPRPNCKMSK